MPAKPEQQQIKQILETAIGPEYLHRTCIPGYSLARKLIPRAVSGLWGYFDPVKTVNDFLNVCYTVCLPGMPRIARILRLLGRPPFRKKACRVQACPPWRIHSSSPSATSPRIAAHDEGRCHGRSGTAQEDEVVAVKDSKLEQGKGECQGYFRQRKQIRFSMP